MDNNCYRKYTEANMQHNCPFMNSLYMYRMACPMMCPMANMQVMGFPGQMPGQFNPTPDFQGVQPFGMYPDMTEVEGMKATDPYKCPCDHTEDPQQYSDGANISSGNGQSFDSVGEETVDFSNENINYAVEQNLWQGNIENIKMRTVDISEIED
ncbi:hypothetical protein [Clostridium sp. DJ247]|uniref:hypothetical protein n=1 Tax=Clostridium sp. DJ247 TaxID=2726188 RepID=UPI0016299195|nr:hypothetical protein [Clostridium sp. DJ247]MBC2580667.1 hypothetical protein [Clostridium sp. DJ247]MBC2580682.1 hypothetical protein [Clostridium sp. DJ247]